MNYYNDNDPEVCAWLRELIRDGHLPPGEIDTRPEYAAIFHTPHGPHIETFRTDATDTTSIIASAKMHMREGWNFINVHKIK